MQTYLDKDNRLSDGHETIKFAKHVVFSVVIGTVNKHLRNALDGQFASLEFQGVGIRSELRGVVVNLVREGRGEEKDLDVFGKHSECISCRDMT